MNPKKCSLVLVLFAVFIPAIIAQSSNDLIEDTCDKTPYSRFCTSRILSDSRSSTAKGPADLVIIMADQAGYNAQSAVNKIIALLDQATDPFVRESLVNCRDSYAYTVNGWVPNSKKAINNNEPRLAYQYMDAASIAAVSCQEEFQGPLAPSPLTDWNDFGNKACTVASTIAFSML